MCIINRRLRALLIAAAAGTVFTSGASAAVDTAAVTFNVSLSPPSTARAVGAAVSGRSPKTSRTFWRRSAI
ncbi:hypothetical protein R80B4_01699 [Fibrobacteres bacterium R8-0-B4]